MSTLRVTHYEIVYEQQIPFQENTTMYNANQNTSLQGAYLIFFADAAEKVFGEMFCHTYNCTFCVETNLAKTLHYAKVAKICILKCPTLTNYFPVVSHPGCPKFCIELCELPKILEK